MGLFLDIEQLSERQTDLALGALYKAIHDHGGDDIWLPLDSPFIARLVELFTQRGLDRLAAFRTELKAWSDGERHRPAMERIARPPGSMERWTPGELALVRLYLEHLPPGEWTLDDHMLLVDAMVQRYMPADDMRSEAEWLTTRAGLMGRVQANMEALDSKQADTLLVALPVTVAAAADKFPMTLPQRATLDFARVRAAENVRNLTNDARHRMRGLISRHVEEKVLGSPGTGPTLETKLGDEFAALNRDWRRIAVTEAGETQLQGYVSSVSRGTKVKRLEQYRNACAFCRRIDGKVMTVVDAGEPNKDGDTQIWPGKTNIGRSAAPRKRIGALLVERDPDELWWTPAGIVHPHCRGRWLPVIQDEPGDDPVFAAFLRATLGNSDAAVPAN